MMIKYVTILASLNVDEDVDIRAAAIMDSVGDDLLNEVNELGSDEHVYKMEFDVKVTDELEYVIEDIQSIADDMELIEYTLHDHIR
jgi:hypothetical protein